MTNFFNTFYRAMGKHGRRKRSDSDESSQSPAKQPRKSKDKGKRKRSPSLSDSDVRQNFPKKSRQQEMQEKLYEGMGQNSSGSHGSRPTQVQPEISTQVEDSDDDETELVMSHRLDWCGYCGVSIELDFQSMCCNTMACIRGSLHAAYIVFMFEE